MGTGQRVEIPAYTDRWMMGDRMGHVVKITKKIIMRDEPGFRGKFLTEIAHVKLDISGKTVKVIYEHCTLR